MGLVLMSHNLVDLLRVPVMMGCPLRDMVAEDDVNVAVQPWSQSWPTERREPDAKEGNMCTVLADGGKLLMLRFAWCVDVMC